MRGGSNREGGRKVKPPQGKLGLSVPTDPAHTLGESMVFFAAEWRKENRKKTNLIPSFGLGQVPAVCQTPARSDRRGSLKECDKGGPIRRRRFSEGET